VKIKGLEAGEFAVGEEPAALDAPALGTLISAGTPPLLVL